MGSNKKHISALDFIRALAIIHIFMYHYYLEWFHGSFLIELGGLGENLKNFQVFQDGGVVGFIKNSFSYFFIYGFTSVNVFLVLSGFVLAFSFYNKGEFSVIKKATDWVRYFLKRFERILIPFYISVLAGIGFWLLRNLLFPDLSAPPLFQAFDLLKLFFFPLLFFDIQFLQLFSGDYWFIPLILQLYLIFPLLYWILKKTGVKGFLFLTFTITVAFRLYAAYFLDTVPMGVSYPTENTYRLFSFFLPRLFEFSFGIGLAYIYATKENIITKLQGLIPFLAGALLTFGGSLLNMYQWGWALSDPIVGIGLFIVFLNIGTFLTKSQKVAGFLKKISDSAYETFLLHHYFLNYIFLTFIFTIGFAGNETAFWIGMPLFFICSVMIGRGAKKVSDVVVLALSKRS